METFANHVRAAPHKNQKLDGDKVSSVQMEVAYRYSDVAPARRFAQGPACQTLPRRCLLHLLRPPRAQLRAVRRPLPRH